MSEGQVREKGVVKKRKSIKIVMVIIERLLPHPAFSHLLPNGEGDINKIF